MSSGQQLLIVDILGCTWHHIENVKEFLLPENYQLAQLFSPVFLQVCSFMIDNFAHYELSLLHKLFQILCFGLRLLWHHLGNLVRNELIL